jgi:hypothetical protein
MVELDVLHSGEMWGTAVEILPAVNGYNCVQLQLGSRVPVNLTHFWVCIVALGNAPPVIQSTDFMFYPNLARVSPQQNRDVDHSPPDPTASDGFLELYFDGEYSIDPGVYQVAVCGVADVLPTLMGHINPGGVNRGVYAPWLSGYFGNTGLTDLAPPDAYFTPATIFPGIEGTDTPPFYGGFHDMRFYAGVEAPFG